MAGGGERSEYGSGLVAGTLELGMYLFSTGKRLLVLEGRKVVGDRILLGEVAVGGEGLRE